MMPLAQKAGMVVEYAPSDTDAYLKLPPASPATIVRRSMGSGLVWITPLNKTWRALIKRGGGSLADQSSHHNFQY